MPEAPVRLPRLRAELEAQGLNDPDHCAELRISVWGERFVEALPAQPSSSRDVDHALRPGNISEEGRKTEAFTWLRSPTGRPPNQPTVGKLDRIRKRTGNRLSLEGAQVQVKPSTGKVTRFVIGPFRERKTPRVVTRGGPGKLWRVPGGDNRKIVGTLDQVKKAPSPILFPGCSLSPHLWLLHHPLPGV